MNAAEVTKLMSELKVAVKPRHRRLKNPGGSEGRLINLSKTVTALLKYERIEVHYSRGDEARGYAERLISDAIRYGDQHKPTMEMADFWLRDKSVIHKLFKVLCPRFENYKGSATRMFMAPRSYNLDNKDVLKKYKLLSVLELNGNPYPPVLPDRSQKNRRLIHNVLLNEARKEFYLQKQKSESDKDVNEEIVTKHPVENINETETK
ncbi:CLUMA_CG005457, isoform A [Clunio marinus]|uniref:Large ribosomal subunit protein bL17m n=1 Tax=Clunio marinus TaxID=568069 RepID=A0A1J1HUZ9_9DIPT|nr:CLUMA_CG005457, isoform A [Clunio marinus]